ncbi:MAG: HDOD domain-containing protein [Gammaproteobacteria bacterium]
MTLTEPHATRDLASDLAASLLDDVSYLVSPPDICVKVFELVESNDASTQQLGEVIGRDPSLTARLLRLVNSAYFNFSRRIDTVSRAVTIVGVRELYSLVIAVSAIKSFSNLPNNLVNIDTFWRHGIYTGLIARALAKQCRVLHPERLFVAGMLHDIGSLVLYNRMPETAADLLLICDGDEGILHQAELAELGFSHADLGGALLNTWMLPETLQEAVCYHHMPGYALSAEREASIVHLADNLANRAQLGAFCEHPSLTAKADVSAWKALGVDEAQFDYDAVIGEAGVQFTETASLLLARA